MPSKTGLLVLGMHRSATSALTHLLCVLGADAPSDPIPATIENADGYWESSALLEIHRQLLSSVGIDWDGLARIPPAWYTSPEAARFKRALLQFLAAEFEASPLFVVKDPRMCRFAGLWVDVLGEFGATAKAVIPIRNPIEVGGSLAARDRLPFVASSLLWLRHVLDAERETRTVPRTFASYDELLEDWRGVARRMGGDLGVSWPRWAEAEAEIDGFLSAAKRHQHVGPGELERRGDVLDSVRTAYAALLALRSNPTHAPTLQILDELHVGLEAATQVSVLLSAEVRRLEAEVRRLEDELGARAHESDLLSERLAASRARIEELSECLTRIRYSRSWRLTQPLRTIASLVRGSLGTNGAGRERDH